MWLNLLGKKRQRTMCFKLFFIFGFSLILNAVSLNSAVSTIVYPASIKSKERSVERALQALNKCRSVCQAEQKKKGRLLIGDRRSGKTPEFEYRPYTKQECDEEYCWSEKMIYDGSKASLDDTKQLWLENNPNNVTTDQWEPLPNTTTNNNTEDENVAIDDKKATIGQSAGDSPLNQVKKRKKKNDVLSVVALGTTAFLTVKAIKCCRSQGCSMCPVWTAMAIAAGIQTKKMFDKSDDLGSTACTMSTDKNDPTCSGGGSKNLQIGKDVPKPPGCPDLETCENLKQRLAQQNPNGGGSGSLADNGRRNADPNMPDSRNTDSGAGILTGTEDMKNSLSDVFRDEWPDGIDPFAGVNTDGYDYESLTGDQKKQADKLMAGLDQRNKDFLNDHGLSSGGGLGDSDSYLTDDDIGGLDGSSGGSSLSSGFGKDGSRALAGSSDNIRRPRSGRKDSIADQMKSMLDKMRAMDGSGNLGDKSVMFEGDRVGVKEDNIFMMVHRMNRKLDRQGLKRKRRDFFIKTISY